MSRTLITTWSEYWLALEKILNIPAQQIRIYDHNLTQLRLESSPAMNAIVRFLQQPQGGSLKITLRDGTHLRNNSPRLLQLLVQFGHKALAQETPEHLNNLRDGMLIFDACHALIRFEQNFPRGILLLDDSRSVAPYVKRFEEIWREGGERISGLTLGL